jgi:outer membrane protein assembly factor BamB
MKMIQPIQLATLACVIAATPALADNDLLVTGESGIIQTVDLEAGTIGFLPVATETVISTAVHDGKLFMGNLDSEVIVFDLETVAIITRFEIPLNASAIAWNGSSLVIGTAEGSVYYMDHESGEILSTIDQVGTDVRAIGVDAGGLFIGGNSSLALRSHIGQEDFQFFAACGSMINSMAFGAQTMYLGGSSFFGDDVGTIYKFDKFVGGVSYAGTFPVANTAEATLEFNGLLYVGGSDGSLIEIDPDDGSVLRTFEISTPIHAITPVNGVVACPVDYDISGELDIFDVITFIDLFREGLPAADTNGDGMHDIFDVLELITRFNSGCE